MKALTELHCPKCQSSKTEPFKRYNTVHNGERRLFKCDECGNVFSEDGWHSHAGYQITDQQRSVCIENTQRRHGGERLFGDQKETLMLYSFCHEFVSLVFDGDELYTVVGSRTDAHASEGWIAVIMERR